MSNPPRHDDPGSRHHVMNRPIAQRVMFDGDVGARRFLDLVAEDAYREGVKFEAFVLMPNHFHAIACPVLPESRQFGSKESPRWSRQAATLRPDRFAARRSRGVAHASA